MRFLKERNMKTSLSHRVARLAGVPPLCNQALNNCYIQRSNLEIKRNHFHTRIGVKSWSDNILENDDSYEDVESIISKV